MNNLSSNFHCGICEGRHARGPFESREMMFGLRALFHYAECLGCGSLWLMDPPADLSVYYPDKYYSFANERGAKWLVKRFLRERRDRSYFGRGGPLGNFLARHYEDGALLSISRLKIGKSARILDVGCGNGKLLRRMAAIGFKNVAGVDPFASNESANGNGVRVRKCRLEDLKNETFDLVMFHHSLEHVPDPKGTLQAAVRVLAPGGKCLVRLPVIADTWEKYGTHWVQLDPPRHMWVPTERAITVLAESVGLKVQNAEYDSTEFQFWGSELCGELGVPLEAASPLRLVRQFGLRGLREFRERASVLNRNNQGDQAAFLLGGA